jgi:hypothetical protein
MDIVSGVALGASVMAAVVALLGFLHSRKKDTKQEGSSEGMLLTEIAYVKANTDEIKAEQREQRKVNTEVLERVSAVEEGVRSAHKRIDRLEGDR